MTYRGYVDGFPEDLDVDGLITGGSEFMDRPGFWAAHYLNQSVDEDDLAAEVWGVPIETIREVMEQLTDPASWPAFEIGLDGDAKLAVVYRNMDGDYGVDYLLVPGSEQECVMVAALEGHYRGPGISWPELSAVADRFADPLERARAMLLLGPMLGDVEAVEPEAIAELAEALRLTGGTGDVEGFARLIVSENPLWEPATWHTTDDGSTVCDEENSPRNPEGPMALKRDDLLMASQLLAS
jgi:hypothetical protein